MRFIAIGMLLATFVTFGRASEMTPVEEWLYQNDDGDYICDTGHYMVRFAKQHGYAGVEVRIHAGTGERLDQYWPPERTHSPMCRFFDNVSFMNPEGGEIQGYLTMNNTFVEANTRTVDGQPALVQRGHLQRRKDEERGAIQFEKTIVFHERSYNVLLNCVAPEGAEYRYANVWFDINDDWSNRFENSRGDLMHLREGKADCTPAVNSRRSFAELDRGYGVWMSVSGASEEILISTHDRLLRSMPHGGFTFFNGPDEEGPEDKYKCHSCMAIGLIAGQHEPVVMEPRSASVTYSVFFNARSDYENLYGGD
ncbi:MAG: hypothetical protein R6V19_10500 [Armatimonadota bacterium]